jgi:hypothetical protein
VKLGNEIRVKVKANFFQNCAKHFNSIGFITDPQYTSHFTKMLSSLLLQKQFSYTKTASLELNDVETFFHFIFWKFVDKTYDE